MAVAAAANMYARQFNNGRRAGGRQVARGKEGEGTVGDLSR